MSRWCSRVRVKSDGMKNVATLGSAKLESGKFAVERWKATETRFF